MIENLVALSIVFVFFVLIPLFAIVYAIKSSKDKKAESDYLGLPSAGENICFFCRLNSSDEKYAYSVILCKVLGIVKGGKLSKVIKESLVNLGGGIGGVLSTSFQGDTKCYIKRTILVPRCSNCMIRSKKIRTNFTMAVLSIVGVLIALMILGVIVSKVSDAGNVVILSSIAIALIGVLLYYGSMFLLPLKYKFERLSAYYNVVVVMKKRGWKTAKSLVPSEGESLFEIPEDIKDDFINDILKTPPNILSIDNDT